MSIVKSGIGPVKDVPLKPFPVVIAVRSPAETWVAIYALIDCCEATAVAESDVKLSSSLKAVPLISVSRTGLVRVLFVRVWEPVIVTTSPVGVLITGLVRVLFVKVWAVVLSTVVPVSIVKVGIGPDKLVPDKPVPATIEVRSPTGDAST